MESLTAIIIALNLVLSQLNIEEERLRVEILQVEIMECESGGNKNAVNYQDARITGYVSRGLYQFQLPSWYAAAKRYKIIPEDMTMDEAAELYADPVYNAAAAHGLIKDGETHHWKNCMDRITLASR